MGRVGAAPFMRTKIRCAPYKQQKKNNKNKTLISPVFNAFKSKTRVSDGRSGDEWPPARVDKYDKYKREFIVCFVVFCFSRKMNALRALFSAVLVTQTERRRVIRHRRPPVTRAGCTRAHSRSDERTRFKRNGAFKGGGSASGTDAAMHLAERCVSRLYHLFVGLLAPANRMRRGRTSVVLSFSKVAASRVVNRDVIRHAPCPIVTSRFRALNELVPAKAHIKFIN